MPKLFNKTDFIFFQSMKTARTTEESKEVPQVYDKDIKDMKGSLKLEAVFEQMMVVIIAIHSDLTRNHKVRIPCVGCLPLTGYTYNTVNDSYSVQCADHCNLGMIGVSYKMKVRGTGGWEVRVPMPIPAIRRYLSLEQRRQLREFQDRFKDQEGQVAFEFVQMVSAY